MQAPSGLLRSVHRAVSLLSRNTAPALDSLIWGTQCSQSDLRVSRSQSFYSTICLAKLNSMIIKALGDLECPTATFQRRSRLVPTLLTPRGAEIDCWEPRRRRAMATHASEAEDEEAFHKAADGVLDTLLEDLEAVIEERGLEEADLEFGQGVMTLKLGGPGTYVINKQAPNREIWMSSPVSGPVRYAHDGKRWIYRRDGHLLHDRLEKELSHLLGGPMTLTRV